MSTPSLIVQNTRLLAVVFFLVELLAAACLTLFLMLPLARRSADDLAGLMVLAAQTWAELPPATRPAFELELMSQHWLALRAESAGHGPDEWHPPYFYLLEDALARRLGASRHLSREQIDDAVWYWVDLPAGEAQLAVGLPRERIATQPLLALILAFGGGLLFAMVVAYGLARRITAPLARLEAAAEHLGLGEWPALLPETGPRELAALARRFNAMAHRVRALLSARTTLLAGVSHDLRTPLARMRLAVEMLRRDPSPGLLERLEKDIGEMNELIATLLDLARGLERETPVDTDLATLLGDLLAAQPASGERLVLECPPGQRAVPPRALRRALGNLLQNALRYAPEGLIEVSGALGPEGCRFEIRDRGPGIPPDRIAAMFEPFQRLEASRSPQTGGAGLGLAIVRELARANGWQVSLNPRDGGGLVATLWLPAKPP